MPTSNNFPTVDSFMLIPTSNFNFDNHAISSSASASSSFTLVGFQMTVRGETINAPPNDGYHISGIEKLKILIAEKIKPPFTKIQLRLILVLGDNFNMAKFQSIHDVLGPKTMKYEKYGEYEQFAIQIINPGN